MIYTLACLIQDSKVEHQSKPGFVKRLPLLKTEQVMNFRAPHYYFPPGRSPLRTSVQGWDTLILGLQRSDLVF
jgi:hypothetical protein